MFFTKQPKIKCDILGKLKLYAAYAYVVANLSLKKHMRLSLCQGCTMKQYNIRLEKQVVTQLDALGGCRSVHIRDAIGLYLQTDTPKGYNVDLSYIHHLEGEVDYLRSQSNALLVNRMPLLRRIIYRLKEGN